MRSLRICFKLYEAIRGSSCADFDNNLVVRMSIREQTGTALDVGEFLDKGKLDYIGMIHLGDWVLSGKSTSVILCRNRYEKDIAVLLAKSKTQAKHISKLTNAVAKAKDTNNFFILNWNWH